MEEEPEEVLVPDEELVEIEARCEGIGQLGCRKQVLAQRAVLWYYILV